MSTVFTCHGKDFRNIKNFKISGQMENKKNTYVFVQDQFYSFMNGCSLCQPPIWQWEELWRENSRLASQINGINLLDDLSNTFKYYSIHGSKFNGQYCHPFYVPETVRLQSINDILWKILTCFLRNLYAGQEATVRTGHETMDWFQIGKAVPKIIVEDSQHCFLWMLYLGIS